ncbi:MAG: DUF3368 domain-containing protein [Candidatus Sulfopaludibacter sp.]|nr:DUF3368 domain-containing protein [Candidatus Sulfopaludibacter sp.]
MAQDVSYGHRSPWDSVAAKNEGQIELLKPELDALRTRARFFLSAPLIEKVLQIAGE